MISGPPEEKLPVRSHRSTEHLDHRRYSTSSDDDTATLKKEELRRKLEQEKRHGKRIGHVFDKLHENYEELLEKYAQAENTIDQLRFQPRCFGDGNTSSSNQSQDTFQFVQQSRTSFGSELLVSTTLSPLATPRPKSVSPMNFESVLSDGPAQETDLVVQSKQCTTKMDAFLRSLNANRLSSSEEQRVYNGIKRDYTKVYAALERTKRVHADPLDTDLSRQLDNMKGSLKEIVKRLTSNLLEQSSSFSDTRRSQRDQCGQSETEISSCRIDIQIPSARTISTSKNDSVRRDPNDSQRSPVVHDAPSNPQANVYRSSLYISQIHNQRSRPSTKDLYFDPQTGIIYRYEPDIHRAYLHIQCDPFNTHHHHHRRPVDSSARRMAPTDSGDLGYESEHKEKGSSRRPPTRPWRKLKRHPHYRIDLSSTDDDIPETTVSHRESITLDTLCRRADRLQHLSRCIRREFANALAMR